jgi:hypothetical protein
METASLVTARTSRTTVSYRLLVDGRIVWSNRAFADVPASHQGARRRAEAWAQQHGYRIVEARQQRRAS